MELDRKTEKKKKNKWELLKRIKITFNCIRENFKHSLAIFKIFSYLLYENLIAKNPCYYVAVVFPF